MLTLNKTIFLLCTSVAAPGCLAQNLIANSTFDANIDGWSSGWPGTMRWDSRDSGNSPTSGSMLLLADSAENQMITSQCVTFTGPGTLQGALDFDGFGGSTYHHATMILIASTATNCTGSWVPSFVDGTDNVAGWQRITTPALVVDATIHSILVRGFQAFIDNVSLRQIPEGTPVTLQSFSVD